jgi:hypothetical protein
MAYELTVGVLPAGGLSEGSSLALSLYYRNATDDKVTLATTSIVYSAGAWPDPNRLVDFQVSLGMVEASDDWAGQEIGIQLAPTSMGAAGYWDLDNVRLAAVPEPATVTLLLLGAVGLWARRAWARRHD